MLFGFAEDATVRPAPAARKLKVDEVMPLMVVEPPPPPPVWSVTHCTTPEAFVESTWPEPQVVEARVKLAEKVLVSLNVWLPVQTTELAAVTKPGFTKAKVLPEKERFAPTTAASKSPELLVLKIEDVTDETTVELLKVAVLFSAAPPRNAWSDVHETELAAVTKPGFTKLTVTVPVAAETERFEPAAMEPTPVTDPVAPLNEET